MADLSNRLENPSPNIAFQMIRISDEANLGTGMFLALLTKDALAHASKFWDGGSPQER